MKQTQNWWNNEKGFRCDTNRPVLGLMLHPNDLWARFAVHFSWQARLNLSGCGCFFQTQREDKRESVIQGAMGEITMQATEMGKRGF